MSREVRNITKKELSKLSTRSFNKKIVLVVDNKYRIFVDGLNTCVEKESNPMITLKENEMPQYIKRFVF